MERFFLISGEPEPPGGVTIESTISVSIARNKAFINSLQQFLMKKDCFQVQLLIWQFSISMIIHHSFLAQEGSRLSSSDTYSEGASETLFNF